MEEGASIAERTVSDYLVLLEALYVLEPIRGWAPPARSPKRFQTKVERVSLGIDGEAQYVNGIGAMSFAPESDGHIDPFHVFRAVARCAPSGTPLGGAGPGLCAHAMGMLGAAGCSTRDGRASPPTCATTRRR